jgi:RNA-directed DNA polymerase
MKRHGNLFDKITDLDNLYRAYYNARRGKCWQRAIIKFNKDVEGNLINIRDSLINKTVTTSPYKTKLIHEPKEREIYILPFTPDRIVQHAIMNIIEPIWEKLFIYDSYACRVGKGIHAGSRRAIINRKTLIIGFRLSDSKYSKNNNSQCLTLHIEMDGKRYVVFTGSVILIEQIEKYKEEIPFLATIKQIDKYYTFS